MRRLVLPILLVLLTVALAPASEGCVAASLCDRACGDYNRLGCGVTCDCSACAAAPPACDSYYDCISTFSGSCVELLVDCPIPDQCESFIHSNCS